ncbi:MAG: DNA topoisomerase IB [Abitibacteriaceae bacterium]|nr:DNA topoisomerase IB [Abditibacteriaceae bacterium]
MTNTTQAKPKRTRAKTIELPEIVTDPVESAKAAGLRYVSDDGLGIQRKKAGKSFTYLDVKGKTIHDPEELKRIRALAIPPAWTNVWICPSPRGHIQATGRDEKGRKQYRYHERWREVRDETKYTRMLAFGQALPKIRERARQDLASPKLTKEKVLATVVQLLEKTLIRVGNEEYTKANRSYGLTTMRNRHVDVEGSHIKFQFKGKSGVRHSIDLNDRRLARVLERLQDLPGQEIFQYVDDAGEIHSIESADVNNYLHEITGEHFTAKDFRTWAGTVLASLALQEFEKFDSETQAKKNVVQAIETVSERLGNTPSVCRKCYVHPAVLDSYMDGSMIETLQQITQQELMETLHDLQPEEAAVMGLLQQRLAHEQQKGQAATA